MVSMVCTASDNQRPHTTKPPAWSVAALSLRCRASALDRRHRDEPVAHYAVGNMSRLSTVVPSGVLRRYFEYVPWTTVTHAAFPFTLV